MSDPRTPLHAGATGMMLAHLERLFAHVFWANRHVLDLLRESAPARQPEVMRLYSHLLGAERVWLLRLQGEDSSIQPIWPELGLQEMEAMSADNEAGYEGYLQRLAEADLAREIEYRNSAGVRYWTRVADVLTHVALHGSYHRGQVARAVRLAGGEPVNTDFITYAREHP